MSTHHRKSLRQSKPPVRPPSKKRSMKKDQPGNSEVTSVKSLFKEALLLEDRADRFGGISSIDLSRTKKLYKDSINCYQQILRLKPDSFDACFNEARLLSNVAQMPDTTPEARVDWYKQSSDMFSKSMALAEGQKPETLLQRRMQLTQWTDSAFSRANSLANLVEELPDSDASKLTLLDESVRLMAAVADKQVELLELQNQDHAEMGRLLQNGQTETIKSDFQPDAPEEDSDSDSEEATELEEISWTTIGETCLANAQLLIQSLQVLAEKNNPSSEMAQEMVRLANAACLRAQEAFQHDPQQMQMLQVQIRRAQINHAHAQLMHQMGMDANTSLEAVIKKFDAILAMLQSIPGLEKRVQAGLTNEERDDSSTWTETLCDKAEACRELALSNPAKLKSMLASSASSFSKACQILYPQAPFTSKSRIYARAGDVEMLRLKLVYWTDLTPAKEAVILARNAVNYFKRMVNEGNGSPVEQRQGLIRSVWAQTWLGAIATVNGDAETVKQAQDQINLALHHLRTEQDVKQALIASDPDETALLAVEKVGWPN